MVERQLVVGVVLAEQRRQVEVEACSTLQRVREQQSEGSQVGHERAQPAGAIGEVHRGVG